MGSGTSKSEGWTTRIERFQNEYDSEGDAFKPERVIHGGSMRNLTEREERSGLNGDDSNAYENVTPRNGDFQAGARSSSMLVQSLEKDRSSVALSTVFSPARVLQRTPPPTPKSAKKRFFAAAEESASAKHVIQGRTREAIMQQREEERRRHDQEYRARLLEMRKEYFLQKLKTLQSTQEDFLDYHGHNYSEDDIKYAKRSTLSEVLRRRAQEKQEKEVEDYALLEEYRRQYMLDRKRVLAFIQAENFVPHVLVYEWTNRPKRKAALKKTKQLQRNKKSALQRQGKKGKGGSQLRPKRLSYKNKAPGSARLSPAAAAAAANRSNKFGGRIAAVRKKGGVKKGGASRSRKPDVSPTRLGQLHEAVAQGVGARRNQGSTGRFKKPQFSRGSSGNAQSLSPSNGPTPTHGHSLFNDALQLRSRSVSRESSSRESGRSSTASTMTKTGGEQAQEFEDFLDKQGIGRTAGDDADHDPSATSGEDSDHQHDRSTAEDELESGDGDAQGTPDGSTESAPSLEDLQNLWFEVSCLLRVPLRTDEQVEEAERRVKESLRFLLTIGKIALDHDVLTGEIFQELLRRLAAGAKDSGSTLVDRDCGDYNAAEKIATTVHLTDEHWSELAQQASSLRQLVRIKLEDKNDLKAAESALVHCRNFFNDAVVAARQELTTVLELMNRPLD